MTERSVAGEVLPSPVSRSRGLAILEVVAGQLYLAVMIARLVSLYAAGEGKGSHRDAQDGPDGSVP